LVSSAPFATVTASSGQVTGNITQSNGTSVEGSESYNFTCSQGLLTYGITTASIQGVPLDTITGFLSNWTGAAPGTLISANGTSVGATRVYITIDTNVTLGETLITDDMDDETGFLHQQWNLTDATLVALTANLTLYDAFDDLTAYTNTTTNTTSLQYFILACLDDQSAGLTAIAGMIEGAITYYAQVLSNPNATTTSAARRFVKLL